MPSGARTAELVGIPLVGVIFAMSVLEYGGPAPFAWIAGGLSLVAIAMSLPKLRRTHFIFLAIGLALVLDAALPWAFLCGGGESTQGKQEAKSTGD